MSAAAIDDRPALVHGPPLSEEPGIGALTLPGFLAEVCARHADAEALVEHLPDGVVVRWTYADLLAQSQAAARALIAGGLGKGERIGLLMTNRLEWVSACFGVAMAGGVVVGLSTFSTPAELAALLDASGISVLIYERQVLARDFREVLLGLDPAIAGGASRRFPFLRRLVAVDEDWRDFLAAGAGVSDARRAATAAAMGEADPAILFFSSGSTGKPKGILNAQRGVNLQSWRWPKIYAVDVPPRTWSANGLFWSGNFSLALGGTLAAGGCLILQRTFQTAEALRLMAVERVSLPYCWPHQWAQLEVEPGWDAADLSAFRYFDADINLRRPQRSITVRWYDPRATYGATETFTISAATPVSAPRSEWEGNNGHPLPGNTIRIVDPESGSTLRRGETGEIAVKGPTLMLGYVGIPSEESFDAEGFYRSGDGGHIDEAGRLVFAGRINDIVKSGGANVSPVEVDWVLGACPGVKICKTTGVPHDTLGEMVVSLVVPEEGTAVDAAAITAFLRQRLAAWKVPRRILAVSSEDLGLTGTAKIRPAEAKALALRMLSTV